MWIHIIYDKNLQTFKSISIQSLTNPCASLCFLRQIYFANIFIDISIHFFHTGWRRPTGCIKLQVIFLKRATNYTALLRKLIKIRHYMGLRHPVNIFVHSNQSTCILRRIHIHLYDFSDKFVFSTYS